MIELPLKVDVVCKRGDAYCDLCDSSQVLCHDLERVGEDYEITQNNEDL